MVSCLLLLGLVSGAGATAEHPFTPGEELRYEVDVLGIPSGMTQVDVGAEEMVANRRTWPIVVIARTEGAADSVWQSRERYVSFWDFEHREVVQGQLVATEMGRHHSLATRFDRGPDGSVAQVEIRNDKGIEHLALPVAAGTQDLASAIFWLRHRPLRPGDEENVPVISSKKSWTLRAKVLDRATVETPAGTFPAVRLSLTTHLAGKIQSNSGEITAYFSDDARHLPLKVESSFMIGKISAQLTRYSAGMPVDQLTERSAPDAR